MRFAQRRTEIRPRWQAGESRFALPDGHAADVVADALAAKIVELPAQLRRGLKLVADDDGDASIAYMTLLGIEHDIGDDETPITE